MSGAATITLDRVIDGTTIYESSTDVAGAPSSADYQVSIGGQMLGTIHVPSFPDPVTHSAGTISWTPMSADQVVMAVIDAEDLWFCIVTDDGSFALPPDLLSAIPAGFATINGHGITHVERNGRDVVLSGTVSATSVSF